MRNTVELCDSPYPCKTIDGLNKKLIIDCRKIVRWELKMMCVYLPVLHILMPRSIRKLMAAMRIPKMPKNTQSSPSRAKVRLHTKEDPLITAFK